MTAKARAIGYPRIRKRHDDKLSKMSGEPNSEESVVHRFSLRFESPEIEAAYLEEFARGAVRQYRVIMPLGVFLYVVAGLFYVASGVFDVGHVPSTNLVIRFLITPPLIIATALFGWSSPKTFARWFQLVGAAGVTSLMVSVVLMIFVGEPNALTPFRVTGMALVVLGAHTLLMLRHVVATAASTIATIAFIGAGISSHVFSASELTISIFYLLIANVLGFFGSRSLESYRRRDFVQRRLIEKERARSDGLLLNVLPEAIAARLKAQEIFIADQFAEVTVLFGDIVGFTPLSQSMTPSELVRALDGVFSAFDDLAARFGLEKIKTIGDAYMVVGGLPTPTKDHAEAVARMALEMRRFIDDYRFRDGARLAMRIGIHSGPAVAGVIGKRKFSYDLWGDTVNIASRMESHGVAGGIQTSEATFELLRARFELEPRGVIDVKGKGQMKAYLLQRERD
jgi:class 3 adenylate cyclase